MLSVFLFGILEGLTEFIPVSSTAHLLLLGKALSVPEGPFLEALVIGIQSGAILAAIVFFWHLVWKQRDLFLKVALAFIPTAIAGVLLYPLIKGLFSSAIVIALALIVGGIALILIRPTDAPADVHSITYKEALLIGLFQIASFIPGISRAGATLIGGSFVRIPRTVIVPFSFLLAIPTIIGASAVEFMHAPSITAREWLLIAVGGIIAFFVALCTIKFFIRLLTTMSLSWFGWYRIALGGVVLIFLI